MPHYSQIDKFDLSIEVFNLIFLLAEYRPLDKSFTSTHFMLQILIQLNHLIILIFYSVPFLKNSSEFVQYFICFFLFQNFIVAWLSYSICNFFPINSPALWTTFVEASSPVSNNYFLYFLANGKNLYPLTDFLALGFIEYLCISIY